jgi:hypothetical protein
MKNWIWLFAFIVAGCNQESEIDKCVQAQAIQACNTLTNNGKLSVLWKAYGYKDAQECSIDFQTTNGADWRLECLKAQAGKR